MELSLDFSEGAMIEYRKQTHSVRRNVLPSMRRKEKVIVMKFKRLIAGVMASAVMLQAGAMLAFAEESAEQPTLGERVLVGLDNLTDSAIESVVDTIVALPEDQREEMVGTLLDELLGGEDESTRQLAETAVQILLDNWNEDGVKIGTKEKLITVLKDAVTVGAVDAVVSAGAEDVTERADNIQSKLDGAVTDIQAVYDQLDALENVLQDARDANKALAELNDKIEAYAEEAKGWEESAKSRAGAVASGDVNALFAMREDVAAAGLAAAIASDLAEEADDLILGLEAEVEAAKDAVAGFRWDLFEDGESMKALEEAESILNSLQLELLVARAEYAALKAFTDQAVKVADAANNQAKEMLGYSNIETFEKLLETIEEPSVKAALEVLGDVVKDINREGEDLIDADGLLGQIVTIREGLLLNLPHIESWDVTDPNTLEAAVGVAGVGLTMIAYEDLLNSIEQAAAAKQVLDDAREELAAAKALCEETEQKLLEDSVNRVGLIAQLNAAQARLDAAKNACTAAEQKASEAVQSVVSATDAMNEAYGIWWDNISKLPGGPAVDESLEPWAGLWKVEGISDVAYIRITNDSIQYLNGKKVQIACFKYTKIGTANGVTTFKATESAGIVNVVALGARKGGLMSVTTTMCAAANEEGLASDMVATLRRVANPLDAAFANIG